MDAGKGKGKGRRGHVGNTVGATEGLARCLAAGPTAAYLPRRSLPSTLPHVAITTLLSEDVAQHASTQRTWMEHETNTEKTLLGARGEASTQVSLWPRNLSLVEETHFYQEK